MQIPIHFTALVVLLTTMTGFSDEPKNISVKTIGAVEQSAVAVACVRKNFSIKQVMASGFLVNRRGHFVTAAHVIQTGWEAVQTKDDPCEPAILAPVEPWRERIKGRTLKSFLFTDCQFGKNIDLAVCKTIDNLFLDADVKDHINSASISPAADYVDGSPVAFTGFPLTYLFPITSKGNVAGFAPFAERLIIDKSAWPGASGSPVYDGNGVIIGMITDAGINYGAGLAYAVPGSSILSFLGECKIPTQK